MSFFGDFFGSSQRRDINKGAKTAATLYQQGAAEAQPYIEQARARLDPYEQTGRNAFLRYGEALGLGGPEAQRAYLAGYIEDPTQELSQRAVARQMAARGLTDSGTSRLAAARVWQEGYNNRLNQLAGLGQQGLAAAGQQGQYDTEIGNLRFGTKQLLANNEINRANAIANTRSIGVNNLLGLGGLAVSAMTGMPLNSFMRGTRA
jgi:hypothetical protein